MNKTIYEQALQAIMEQKPFSIDLKNHDLKINGKYIIKDGKFQGELGIAPETKENWIKSIESYYGQYADSVPNLKNNRKRKRHFIANKDISDNDWEFGEVRDIAQFNLEFYILCQILQGSMQWTEDLDIPGWRSAKWFWQNLADKKLIILKEWF